MKDLFDTPIKKKNITKEIVAYQYRNGTINIEGQKYIGYSMTEAINIFKKNHKPR